MAKLAFWWCSLASAAVVLCCRTGRADEELAALLKTARAELRAAQLPEDEVQLRLKVVENVATVKAYYPHAEGGPPEYRNPKYWKENHEGSYVPRGSATEAIRDLWKTKSGIRCTKLSTLVMLKAMIDVADEKRLAELDEMLRDKVIPNDLRSEGIGTFFDDPDPRKGAIFHQDELLAGDEVWFENPYFELLGRQLQRRYIGQEGHHVFYVGGGQVMDMYSREAESIAEFRETFLRWKSVRIAAEQENRQPKADEFQIKAMRRVIAAKR